MILNNLKSSQSKPKSPRIKSRDKPREVFSSDTEDNCDSKMFSTSLNVNNLRQKLLEKQKVIQNYEKLLEQKDKMISKYLGQIDRLKHEKAVLAERAEVKC